MQSTEFASTSSSSFGDVSYIDVNAERKMPGAPARVYFAESLPTARAMSHDMSVIASNLEARKVAKNVRGDAPPFTKYVFVPAGAASRDEMMRGAARALRSRVAVAPNLRGKYTPLPDGAPGILYVINRDSGLPELVQSYRV